MRLQSDFIGIGCEAAGVVADFIWESGGEEDDLELLADSLNKATGYTVSRDCCISNIPGSLFDVDTLVAHLALVKHIVGLI